MPKETGQLAKGVRKKKLALLAKAKVLCFLKNIGDIYIFLKPENSDMENGIQKICVENVKDTL